MFLKRRNDAFVRELVLVGWCMPLLIVESAKNPGILTQIQKASEVNLIHPIVTGVQMTLLSVVAEFATSKVVVQSASTLLRVRLDQNSIGDMHRMAGRHQKH